MRVDLCILYGFKTQNPLLSVYNFEFRINTAHCRIFLDLFFLSLFSDPGVIRIFTIYSQIFTKIRDFMAIISLGFNDLLMSF